MIHTFESSMYLNLFLISFCILNLIITIMFCVLRVRIETMSCLPTTLAKFSTWHARFMAAATCALTWKCATASTLHNFEVFSMY